MDKMKSSIASITQIGVALNFVYRGISARWT